MVLKIQIDEAIPPVYRIRSILAQAISCISSSLLLLDLGLAVGFVTIALADLLDAKSGLSLNKAQASWFGSLSYLTQPLGGLIAGPLVDYFGRKKAIFLANIPHLVAWVLLYFAWNVPVLFFAYALLGFGKGIIDAPVCTYVSEISEPSLRGALSSTTQLFVAVGLFAMYFLGTIVDYSHAALIAVSVPILSMIAVLFAPETPVWLLAQNREKDALRSLCFLRGWTTPDSVQEEFDKLIKHSKKLQLCAICEKTDTVTNDCQHQYMHTIKRFILKFNIIMLCKETLRPLLLMLTYLMFHVTSGLPPIRPNMANICSAFGMADDPKKIVLNSGIILLVTAFSLIFIIRTLGKRKIAISSMLGTAISCTLLGVYARAHLPSDVFSYEKETFPEGKSIIPLIYFYAMIVSCGFNLSYLMVGEVFPYRSRATSQGISVAWSYLLMFIAAKTFIDLELSFSLWGTFAIYAAFGYLGTVYLYFFLPETEGKSLQEIEMYYNGNLRTFADDPFINYFKRFKTKL